jgi:hypothetical protein
MFPYVESVPEGLRTPVNKRHASVGECRVVDTNIDATELLLDGREHGQDVFLLRQVTADRAHHAASPGHPLTQLLGTSRRGEGKEDIKKNFECRLSWL